MDTSSWVEYLRHLDSEPSRRVEQLVLGDEAGWCDMVAVELWNGTRGAREKRELAELEKEITFFPIDTNVWGKARKLAQSSRDAGLSAPSADIVIAACANHYGLELEHCDAHFSKILPIAKTL